ncbi:hypothetical protein ACNKHS_18525 [Shigella flexneri]
MDENNPRHDRAAPAARGRFPNSPKVLVYIRCTRDKAQVGDKVPIIRVVAGLVLIRRCVHLEPGESTSQNIPRFCNEWGSTSSLQQAGGLSRRECRSRVAPANCDAPAQSQQTGTGLGKTTGSIHRTTLLSRGVK